jgi:hypothetical protein
MVLLIDTFSINMCRGYENSCLGYYFNRALLEVSHSKRQVNIALSNQSVLSDIILTSFWYYCGVVMVILVLIYHFYLFIYVLHTFYIWNITR